MRIDIIAKPFKTYAVSVDGKTLKEAVPFTELPAIIDSLYEERESKVHAKLVCFAEDLRVRADSLEYEAAQLREQADEIDKFCEGVT